MNGELFAEWNYLMSQHREFESIHVAKYWGFMVRIS